MPLHLPPLHRLAAVHSRGRQSGPPARTPSRQARRDISGWTEGFRRVCTAAGFSGEEPRGGTLRTAQRIVMRPAGPIGTTKQLCQHPEGAGPGHGGSCNGGGDEAARWAERRAKALRAGWGSGPSPPTLPASHSPGYSLLRPFGHPPPPTHPVVQCGQLHFTARALPWRASTAGSLRASNRLRLGLSSARRARAVMQGIRSNIRRH